MILISISNQISCYVDELQNYRNKIQFSYHRFYKNAYNWLFKPQSTVWVQKSSLPKTFCNIFTRVNYISVKFRQYVASLYLHILTNFGRFILIFNKMALIFLGVPIVFNVSSFKFY